MIADTPEGREEQATPPFPAGHLDLLDRPLSGALTTHLASGRLQSTVVWYWREGGDVLVSTMAEFCKAQNMLARPRATLLVLEPVGRQRWIEIRADVRPESAHAMAELDAVGRRYTGVEPYFGAVVPASLATTEHPVTFRLVPSVVVVGPTSPRLPPTRGGEPGPVTPATPATAGTTTEAAPTAPLPATPRPATPRPATPHPATPLPATSHPASSLGRVPLPASHHDLFDRPLLAVLSTRIPDGTAQSQPVWCARDGDVVLVSTTAERRKGRNLLADPRATLLVVDPADSSRWIEVRADAELVTDGAVDLLDHLTRAYTDRPAYYGHLAPEEFRTQETRMTIRLHPRRVNRDAIHR